MTCPDRLRFFVPASIAPALPSGISLYPNQPVRYGLDEFTFERGEKAELFPGGFRPIRSFSWEGEELASQKPIYEGLMNWQQENKANGVVQLIPVYDFYSPQVDVGADRVYFRVPSTTSISETVLDASNTRFQYWRALAGYLLFQFPDFIGGTHFKYEATFFESRALLRTDET